MATQGRRQNLETWRTESLSQGGIRQSHQASWQSGVLATDETISYIEFVSNVDFLVHHDAVRLLALRLIAVRLLAMRLIAFRLLDLRHIAFAFALFFALFFALKSYEKQIEERMFVDHNDDRPHYTELHYHGYN